MNSVAQSLSAFERWFFSQLGCSSRTIFGGQKATHIRYSKGSMRNAKPPRPGHKTAWTIAGIGSCHVTGGNTALRYHEIVPNIQPQKTWSDVPEGIENIVVAAE
jgi:hypothetical protein